MPRRWVVGLVLLAPLSATAQADGQKPAPPASDGPRLKVDSKALDFGEIVHGTKAELELGLHNDGTETLILKSVQPSCGCTVAEYPETIEPGQSASMKVVFDSSERPAGYQSFRIAIYTNDPTQKDLGSFCTLVNLRGEVRTLYRLAPHGAYFGEFIRGVETKEKAIKITGLGEAKDGFTARLTAPPPDYLQVELQPFQPEDGRNGVNVTVKMLPDVPLGAVEHSLTFATNVEEQPTFRILVTALVNTRITGPAAVHFGSVERRDGAERLVPIERRDGLEGISIARIQFDPTLLGVEAKTISSTRTELTVKVHEDAPPGAFALPVRLFLDDDKQGLVELWVYGRVMPRVLVDPPAVLLPEVAEQGKPLAVVTVRGRAKVTGARIEPEGLLEARVGRDRKIELLPRLGGSVALWPDATLVIETDVAGEERVEVPLIKR